MKNKLAGESELPEETQTLQSGDVIEIEQAFQIV